MDAGLFAQYVMNGLMLGMMYALGRGRLHAVLRRARRHQVLAWRRAHRRRLHRARDLRRAECARLHLAMARSRRHAGAGDAGDGAARHADRALSGDAAALGAGAQHAADHADARHGAARRRAAVLSAGRQSEAVSGAAAAQLDQSRRFQPAARQRADARGRCRW